MGMSCFTSLNSQLFKNIAYVGYFKHFSVQFFYIYFATQPRPLLTAVNGHHSIIQTLQWPSCLQFAIMPSHTLQCLEWSSSNPKFRSPLSYCTRTVLQLQTPLELKQSVKFDKSIFLIFLPKKGNTWPFVKAKR